MRYEIAGKRLTCPHCASERFDQRTAQLNTAGLTFFDLNWLNRSAWIFQCLKCGRVEWFASTSGVELTEVAEQGDDSDEQNEEVECLTCGALIPVGQITCGFCGWSYKD